MVFAVLLPAYDLKAATLLSQKYPRHLQIAPGQWLVAATGTAKDIGEALGFGEPPLPQTVSYWRSQVIGDANPITSGNGLLPIGRKGRSLMPDQEQTQKTTPERFPVTTPGVAGLGEHSGLILTTVMELQRSVGGLIQAVDTLTTRLDNETRKLDSISHRMYAAGAVIVVLLGAIGWFLNNFTSIALKILEQHIH